MPRLYSSKTIIKILEQNSFLFISQKGSHLKYRRNTIDNQTLTVIVPANKREIPYGTFRSILRQSKLTESSFSS